MTLGCPGALRGSLALWLAALVTTPLLFFYFLIPSCNSLKGASYQRAAFSSATAASSYSLQQICWCSVGGVGKAGRSVLGGNCQSQERPEGLHNCPVWSLQTEVLLSPSYSSMKLSQPLHCFIQHTLTCPVPGAGSSHFHSSACCLPRSRAAVASTSSARSSSR